MKPIEIFRKNGYKQRYRDSYCVIYDLKKKDEYNTLPDTIIIKENGVNIELCTENIEEYTHLGQLSFSLTKELLQSIEQKMGEYNEK